MLRRRSIAAVALTWFLCGCLVSFDESMIPGEDSQPDQRIDAASNETAVDAAAPDTMCTEDPRCDDGQLVRCTEVLSTCPLGCVADPAPHCSSFVPSNSVPAPAAREDIVEIRVDKDAALEACTGNIVGIETPQIVFSTIDQEGGPKIGVLQVHSLIIAPGATLKVIDFCALAIVAYRSIDIEGAIDAGGGQNAPYVAGPGGYQGAYSKAAEGCGFGSDGVGADLGGGGGGALGTNGGAGPGGGAGGVACALETLSPLRGGSGGGHGGCATNPCVGGHGGGGGGAVALVAGEFVRLGDGGGVIVAGGGGEGGVNASSGGGGGGSGGGLLIEAPIVLLSSAAVINAGGGGGGGVSDDAKAARGARGTLVLEPAAGGTGFVTGGNGSAFAANGSGGEASADGNGSGGGGGGGGFVRINSAEQVDLPDIFGVVSVGALTLP